jgi:hypothetical protein
MEEHKPYFQHRVLRGYARWAQGQETHIINIQRWWRHWYQLRPCNTVDCITLEALEPPFFLHVAESGHVTAFSAMSLAQYMVVSGNFKHPQFRTDFNTVELRRLDKCTGNKFRLVVNQTSIQEQQEAARLESHVDEFLVNEFTGHIRACLELCTQPCSYFQWALGMREHTEPLQFEYLTLYAHNTELAQQTLQHAVETVERQGTEMVASIDSLASYIELYDRFLKFVLLLRTFDINPVHELRE